MLSPLHREFKQTNILLIFLFFVYTLSLFVIYVLRYPLPAYSIYLKPPEISDLEAKQMGKLQWDISIKIKNPNLDYPLSDILYEVTCLSDKNLQVGNKEGKIDEPINPGEEIVWEDAIVNCSTEVSSIKFRLFRYGTPESDETSPSPPANQ